MIYMWTIVTESASPGDVQVLHVTNEETIKAKLSYNGRMATNKKALFIDYPLCVTHAPLQTLSHLILKTTLWGKMQSAEETQAVQ